MIPAQIKHSVDIQKPVEIQKRALMLCIKPLAAGRQRLDGFKTVTHDFRVFHNLQVQNAKTFVPHMTSPPDVFRRRHPQQLNDTRSKASPKDAASANRNHDTLTMAAGCVADWFNRLDSCCLRQHSGYPKTIAPQNPPLKIKSPT